ncbi:hypothetical protein B7486_53680, partial [cyanobacterium TDX16]
MSRPNARTDGPAAFAGGLLDFVVLGNPKSGTTTLHDLLGQHPDVFLPERKEPYHYAPDLTRGRIGPFHPCTASQYEALFAPAAPGQRRGEASACYVMSSVAVEAIPQANSGCRAIVVYREPVAFLHAWHLQMLRDPRHEVVADLDEALRLEAPRAEGRQLPPDCALPELLAYRDHVRYAAQLARIQTAFGDDHVLPILFDDLAEDPSAVAARCFRFLELDPDVEVSATHRNSSVAVTRPRLEATLIRAANGAPGDRLPYRVLARLLRLVPRRLYDAMRWLLRTVLHRQPDELDHALAARLHAELEPEVDALGEAMGV